MLPFAKSLQALRRKRVEGRYAPPRSRHSWTSCPARASAGRARGRGASDIGSAVGRGPGATGDVPPGGQERSPNGHRFRELADEEEPRGSLRRRVPGHQQVRLLREQGQEGGLRPDLQHLHGDLWQRARARQALVQVSPRRRGARHPHQHQGRRRGRELRVDRHVQGLRGDRRRRGLHGDRRQVPHGGRDREAPRGALQQARRARREGRGLRARGREGLEVPQLRPPSRGRRGPRGLPRVQPPQGLLRGAGSQLLVA